MSKLYSELAKWWYLLSPVADYAEEAAFFLNALQEVTDKQSPTLLELGSGGGNNASYMKAAFASTTLVDLSEDMLNMSRTLNPDCEHLLGDMRTTRLDKTFDAVFIHDAIDYMTTLDDLKQALETAYVHCKAGGIALFVPDDVRETFEDGVEHGGTDGDGRSLRYFEWSYDPDPDDTTIITDYVVLFRETDQPAQMNHDQHTLGLFARDEWLDLMQQVGFSAEFLIDDYDRHLFVGRKS